MVLGPKEFAKGSGKQLKGICILKGSGGFVSRPGCTAAISYKCYQIYNLTDHVLKRIWARGAVLDGMRLNCWGFFGLNHLSHIILSYIIYYSTLYFCTIL